MVDSDDVLLLRPAWPESGLSMRGRSRPTGPVRLAPPGLVDLTVFPLREPASAELLAFCREVMSPCLQRGAARSVGWYVTDEVPNDFPRLPVREDGPALVGVAVFGDAAAFEAFAAGGSWAREVEPRLSQWLRRPAESHRLVPTARSAIHG